MKIIKLFIPIFALFLMSCIDEPVPEKTEKEIVQEITRTWQCVEDEEGFPVNFDAVIKVDPSNEAGILIYNFHGMGETEYVKAVVNTDLTIEIPLNEFPTQTIIGTGEISNDFTRIDWDYTLEIDDSTVRITGTYTYGTTS